MIIFWIGLEGFRQYLELMREGISAEPARPHQCWKCAREDCFWKHGWYQRSVEEGDEREEIAIARFKCYWCGKTVSVLPSFVVPKRRYTMNVVAEGVERYATKPTTYRDCVTKLGATGPSPTQLFRWVALLVERVNALTLEAQASCIDTDVPDEQMEQAETAKCPNSCYAVTVGKRKKLDQLAKLVAFCRALYKKERDILLEFGKELLQDVEQMQQMFAHEGIWMPTPQRVKP